MLPILLLACAPSGTWLDAFAEARATLEATGECPTAPPEWVPMSDGRSYLGNVQVEGGEGMFLEGRAWADDVGPHLQETVETSYVLEGWQLSVAPPRRCGEYETRSTAVRTGFAFEIWDTLDGAISPPVFLAADEGGVAPGNGRMTVDLPPDDIDEGWYAWVCLEDAGANRADEARGAENRHWRGSLFAHADDVDGAPDDLFVTFDHVDCYGYDEHAEDWWDEEAWQWHVSGSCDGVDNDLDGEIDEGASDHDDDGAPDCLDPDPE